MKANLIHAYSSAALTQLADILKQGGVAIVPTGTVYGLVCHPAYPEALERIRAMKQRDRDKPFQLLMASTDAVWADGALRTPTSEAIAQFWPGALTAVLNTRDGRTEGYRVPNDPQLQTLLTACGGALRATSVNISGEPPAVAISDIPESILNAVDFVLDGGAIQAAEASTVVQIDAQNNLKLLRSGSLAQKIFAE
jgi:L-threonylcarbamoyladenylate synthase